jgi:hypothetical protein
MIRVKGKELPGKLGSRIVKKLKDDPEAFMGSYT